MKPALAIYSVRNAQSSRGPTRTVHSVVVAKPVTDEELPTPVMVQQVTRLIGPNEVGIPREIEIAILAVLEGPVGFGETIETTFRRKEHELGALFTKLTAIECRALHKRLENPKAGDALALRFSAMISVRRARLLAFLQDARRREAIAGGRR
jgi:hypothetical protein